MQCGLSRAPPSLLAVLCLLSAQPAQITSLAGILSFPIMVPCLSARAPSYPQQGWSPAHQSRNGAYRKASKQLWLLQGRQDDGLPGMIETQALAAPGSSDEVCCHPALCHGRRLQVCSTGVLTLLAQGRLQLWVMGPLLPWHL